MTNKKRMLSLFEELISIDSPSYGEREICDYIKTALSGLGLTAYEDGAAQRIKGNCGNLYVHVDGEIDLPPLLFCAHMDTVEPCRGKRMKIDQDGRITSEGETILGADDCAGIAAIFEALTALRESGRPHRPIEILFTVAEEPYSVGARQVDFSLLQAKEAYVFDLTGEVGGAAYQAPTILSFQAVFRGRSAHAGFEPEQGIHAIKGAGIAVSRISCGHVGDATVNIGTISGGTANNIVPDHCLVTGEIRSLSDEAAHKQMEAISVIMKEAAGECGVSVEINFTVHCTAYQTPLNHAVVKRFESACAQNKVEPHLVQTYGGSDNNHFALNAVAGIVVANAMNNCHSTSEYSTVNELEKAAELALTLMLSRE